MNLAEALKPKRERAIDAAVKLLSHNYEHNKEIIDRERQLFAEPFVETRPHHPTFNEKKFAKLCDFSTQAKAPFCELKDICISWLESGEELPEPVRQWIKGFLKGEITPPKKQGKQKNVQLLCSLAYAAHLVHTEFGYNYDINPSSTHKDYAYLIVAEAAQHYGLKNVTDNTVRDASKKFARDRKKV